MVMRSLDTRIRSITNRKKDSLDKYLSDIAKYEPLSIEEEVNLFKELELLNPEHKEVKDLDKETKEKVLAIKTKISNANLRFVVSVAKKYQQSNISLLDLINEWNLWLWKAIDRFDYTRWFKLISYAVWWIRQSILQYIASENPLIRRPMNQEGIRRRIQNYENRFVQENYRQPTKDEIMEDLWLDEKDYEKYRNTTASFDVKSLDDTWYTDDSPMYDVVPDTKIKSPDFDLQLNDQRTLILNTLKGQLRPHEFEIITSYFGIWKERPKSFEEIAHEMDLSRERVRQITNRVCTKLSKILHWTELHNLYKSLND